MKISNNTVGQGITEFMDLSIVRYYKEYNVSKTRSLSVLRWGGRKRSITQNPEGYTSNPFEST
jgi:hypothetical protein